jgi:predicted acyltransferase
MEAGRRLESIDQFRGFAIILMVATNYLAGVESIPTWLKHAPDSGLTIIDLIAPFFIFAVGLAFVLSAQRRFKSEGWRKMAVHFSKRGLALIGLGALITAGENYFDITPLPANWGVLQLIVLVVVLSVIGWFFDRKNWIFSL